MLVQLEQAGFEVERLLPLRVLLGLERVLQPALAPLRFGPSMWVLARRAQADC